MGNIHPPWPKTFSCRRSRAGRRALPRLSSQLFHRIWFILLPLIRHSQHWTPQGKRTGQTQKYMATNCRDRDEGLGPEMWRSFVASLCEGQWVRDSPSWSLIYTIKVLYVKAFKRETYISTIPSPQIMTSAQMILICVTWMQFVAILKARTRASANRDT